MSDITSPVPSTSLPQESPSVVAVTSTQPAITPARGLRIWPGLVIVALQWLLIKVPGWVSPASMIQFMGMFWGPVLGVAALAIWWLFFSRVRWAIRWLGLLACAGAGAAAWALCHPTLGVFGLMIYTLPLVTTAWVLWLAVTPFLRMPVRFAGLLVVFMLVWGYATLLRLAGIDGSMTATLEYRWQRTAEQKFLADVEAGKLIKAAIPEVAGKLLTLEPGDWPGFRGAKRDGCLTGVRIATDWKGQPPRQLWRHRVGPGWSSFAAVGTRLYTQEQRGEEEAVVCYDADSGAELWAHADSARFNELVSGPGPRATPTFHEGKLYALGAAGRLNCLDPLTGRVVWSQDIVADSGAKVPIWGFAASPLVARGIVTVFAGGEQKSVLGYEAASGKLAWSAGQAQLSYCSLHPAHLAGVEQVVIATDAGLTAFDPAGGQILWQYDWPLKEMARVVQPTLVSDSDLLVGTGMGFGTRRVHLERKDNSWTTAEVWASKEINPYFNDVVVHRGHIYGFDSNFLTCINLDDGKRTWKTRGYGNGQVLLVADQDLLLVLSEKGEAALVEANPQAHKELARFQAVDGKTWNHPVVARGKLFVRNGEEAACYQLKLEADAASK